MEDLNPEERSAWITETAKKALELVKDWDEEAHPRGEGGRFGSGGGGAETSSGNNAQDLDRMAQELDRPVGKSPLRPDNAIERHRIMADEHRQLAEQASARGDGKTAGKHSDAADRHDKAARAYAAEDRAVRTYEDKPSLANIERRSLAASQARMAARSAVRYTQQAAS
jgi:hypothetical protein